MKAILWLGGPTVWNWPRVRLLSDLTSLWGSEIAPLRADKGHSPYQLPDEWGFICSVLLSLQFVLFLVRHHGPPKLWQEAEFLIHADMRH